MCIFQWTNTGRWIYFRKVLPFFWVPRKYIYLSKKTEAVWLFSQREIYKVTVLNRPHRGRYSFTCMAILKFINNNISNINYIKEHFLYFPLKRFLYGYVNDMNNFHKNIHKSYPWININFYVYHANIPFYIVNCQLFTVNPSDKPLTFDHSDLLRKNMPSTIGICWDFTF